METKPIVNLKLVSLSALLFTVYDKLKIRTGSDRKLSKEYIFRDFNIQRSYVESLQMNITRIW
jgi:hypothetical protein